MTENNPFVRRIQIYKSQLFNFKKRNKELYFKPSTCSLNLSENLLLKPKIKAEILTNVNKEDFEKNIKKFSPINLSNNLCQKLVQNGGFGLSAHFMSKALPSA